jgi:hypothetical protein
VRQGRDVLGPNSKGGVEAGGYDRSATGFVKPFAVAGIHSFEPRQQGHIGRGLIRCPPREDVSHILSVFICSKIFNPLPQSDNRKGSVRGARSFKFVRDRAQIRERQGSDRTLVADLVPRRLQRRVGTNVGKNQEFEGASRDASQARRSNPKADASDIAGGLPDIHTAVKKINRFGTTSAVGTEIPRTRTSPI